MYALAHTVMELYADKMIFDLVFVILQKCEAELFNGCII